MSGAADSRRSRERPARALARAERLRSPEQFAALAGERATWRAARQWLAAAARVESIQAAVVRRSGDSVEGSTCFESAGAGVRFGFTVARRQARRSVQRVMVKRVLREAARNQAHALRELAQGRTVDVVLRLRSSLPVRSQMNLAEVKRSLRAEADSLIAQLLRHLRRDA